MVIKDYYRVIKYNLSREVLEELENAISVGLLVDVVVESFILRTYGPQNSQDLASLRILIKKKWIVAILADMSLQVTLVSGCLIEVYCFHILAEVTD